MSSNPLGATNSKDWGTDYFNPNSVFSNPWYSRLVKDPDFWQKWIDRWQLLRRKEFTTNSIFRAIEIMTNQLRLAQSREIARWGESQPRSGLIVPPAGWPDRSYSNAFPAFGTYAGEIAFLKRWLADRLDFIDTNFLAQPTLSQTGGLVSVGQTITLTPPAKPGSWVIYTLDGKDPRSPGGGVAPTMLYSSTPVTLQITNNIRLIARSWNDLHHNLTGTNNPPISSPWSGPVVESFYTALPPLRVTEIMYHPLPPPPGN